MVCTPAQLSANRRNSQSSTGPQTVEGKTRSRSNALKHGLTGDGVAILDEDKAAVQERFVAFKSDLKPRNAVGQFLVLRAAMLSVRMERSVRNESAEITREMLRAPEVDDDARADEITRLIALLAENPAEAIRRLVRTPEGLGWMILAWDALKNELVDPNLGCWTSKHCDRAEQLTGRLPKDFGISRIFILSQAIHGDLRMLKATDWPDLSPMDRVDCARAEMIAITRTEIARLGLIRQGLDHESIAAERAGAAERAIFSMSPKAILARRYEAAAEREFYRALKQIEQVNQAAEAEGEPVASLEEEAGSDELGSYFPEAVNQVSAPLEAGRFDPRIDHDRPETATRPSMEAVQPVLAGCSG